MAEKMQYGINLNSDPRAPDIRPADPADLTGLKWARMVFLFHDVFQLWGYDLGNFNNYNVALQKAFNFYDGLIAGYAQVGVRTLLILNQESFAGAAPWFPGAKIEWDEAAADQFATDFAAFCGQIAAHYKGQGIAYEIWNEGDVKPNLQNPEASPSVYVQAKYFAPILQRASAAIKAQDPTAFVVSGGLATGAGEGVQYLNAIKAILGNLPVDAIGIHPYCQYIGQNKPNIPGLWAGKIDTTLKTYINAFPNHKFWITEIGVSDVNPIEQEFWPAIADYMEGMCNRIQERYADHMKAFIWFGWSDRMRNAGIVDVSNQRKQPIYNRFFMLAQQPVSLPAAAMLMLAPEALQAAQLTLKTGISTLNVRAGEGTQFAVKGQINSGDKLVIIEADVKAALKKVGKQGQWINIRTPDNVEGFAAAWFLQRIIDLDSVSFPTEDATGTRRALGFNHTPVFTVLPIVSGPTDVHWFNGFGPNNYAYNDFRTHVGEGVYYRHTFGLHNGLDFGIPFGTPLCAVDWGRVVQVSSNGQTPFAARPFTVGIRYGRYIAVYGHMKLDSAEVKVGDIVAPGQKIGESGHDAPPAGIDPTPHLHFEMRELNLNYALTLAGEAEGADDELLEMNNLFTLNDAIANVTNYTNPARFFSTSLASYGWPNGMSLPTFDTDHNGYPDQVILKGDTLPTVHDITSYESYPVGQTGSYWTGSHPA